MNTYINLLHREGGSLRNISELEDKVRMASVWALGSLLIIGVIALLSFIFLNTRIKGQEANKIELMRRINSQSAKEALLLSLKDRVGIAGKALLVAKPWGKLFPILTQITQGGGFNSLTVEENGRVISDMTVPSVDYALSIVTNMMGMTIDHIIRSPQLLTFSLRENGQVHMSISFYPVL